MRQLIVGLVAITTLITGINITTPPAHAAPPQAPTQVTTPEPEDSTDRPDGNVALANPAPFPEPEPGQRTSTDETGRAPTNTYEPTVTLRWQRTTETAGYIYAQLSETSYRTSIDGWRHFGSACTP